MDTKRDFHTPQWLGNEIVAATLCTNTGLQNITRPAGVKDARKIFDYLEVGTGVRKVRLYSTADAIFIKASAVLSRLRVQPRAAAFYSRFVVAWARKKGWAHDIDVPNAWMVLDGIEVEYDGSLIPFPYELFTDDEILTFVTHGAVVLNVSKIVVDALIGLEKMREHRLLDRGKTRNEMSPEQAARRVRKMEKDKTLR
jgi:hypothetical protein